MSVAENPIGRFFPGMGKEGRVMELTIENLKNGEEALDRNRQRIDWFLAFVTSFLAAGLPSSPLQPGGSYVNFENEDHRFQVAWIWWCSDIECSFELTRAPKRFGSFTKVTAQDLRCDEVNFVYKNLGKATVEYMMKNGWLPEFEKRCKPFLSALAQ